MKRWLTCARTASRYELSDRPRWTDEKALACDMATKQDVLDVMKMIEEADGFILLPGISRLFAMEIGCSTLRQKWGLN